MPVPFQVLLAAAPDSPILDLATSLDDAGLRVAVCCSADQTDDRLAAGLPDTVILDGSLPGAELLRTYANLRSSPEGETIPVIFTGHAASGAQESTTCLDIYLGAPAGAGELFQALRGVLLAPPASDTNGLIGPRVLPMAGSDRLAAELLARLVEAGLEASTCVSAPEALEQMADQPPHAAVLDASLPGADLLRVYTALRERPDGASLPVLFINDASCPHGAIVSSGADLYLGPGASLDEAVQLLHSRLVPAHSPDPTAELDESDSPSRSPHISSELIRRWSVRPLMRALPVAGMVLLGGLAGLTVVQMFSSQGWFQPLMGRPVVIASSQVPTEPTIERATPQVTEAPPVAWAAPADPVAQPPPDSPIQAADCQFPHAFMVLRDLIGPDVVGVCLDDQEFASNGDAEQRTTNGLLVWRRVDNWVAFTDGHQTWVSGPFGLEVRLNNERFPWESTAVVPQRSVEHIQEDELVVRGG